MIMRKKMRKDNRTDEKTKRTSRTVLKKVLCFVLVACIGAGTWFGNTEISDGQLEKLSTGHRGLTITSDNQGVYTTKYHDEPSGVRNYYYVKACDVTQSNLKYFTERPHINLNKKGKYKFSSIKFTNLEVTDKNLFRDKYSGNTKSVADYETQDNIESRRERKISLSWNKVKNATGYEVRVRYRIVDSNKKKGSWSSWGYQKTICNDITITGDIGVWTENVGYVQGDGWTYYGKNPFTTDGWAAVLKSSLNLKGRLQVDYEYQIQVRPYKKIGNYSWHGVDVNNKYYYGNWSETKTVKASGKPAIAILDTSSSEILLGKITKETDTSTFDTDCGYNFTQTGYEIKYADNKSMTGAATKKLSTTENLYSVDPSFLPSYGKWYLKARTVGTDPYGKKIYGAWTSVRTYKYSEADELKNFEGAIGIEIQTGLDKKFSFSQTYRLDNMRNIYTSPSGYKSLGQTGNDDIVTSYLKQNDNLKRYTRVRGFRIRDGKYVYGEWSDTWQGYFLDIFAYKEYEYDENGEKTGICHTYDDVETVSLDLPTISIDTVSNGKAITRKVIMPQ